MELSDLEAHTRSVFPKTALGTVSKVKVNLSARERHVNPALWYRMLPEISPLLISR